MPAGRPATDRIASCRVSRGAALVRGFLWASAAVVCGAASFAVFHSLDFSPAGGSWRAVDVGILIVMLPVATAALCLAVLGLRWIGLALWPGFVGVVATRSELAVHLGPFGTRRFDASRLDVKYPFELSADENGGFEAFLPEEEQVARFLPRIGHPSSDGWIHLLILKFVRRSEEEIVESLRPALKVWRSRGLDREATDWGGCVGGEEGS